MSTNQPPASYPNKLFCFPFIECNRPNISAGKFKKLIKNSIFTNKRELPWKQKNFLASFSLTKKTLYSWQIFLNANKWYRETWVGRNKTPNRALSFFGPTNWSTFSIGRAMENETSESVLVRGHFEGGKINCRIPITRCGINFSFRCFTSDYRFPQFPTHEWKC